MKYRVDYTNRFKKDFRIAEKRGKDMEKLRRVILELAEGHVLDPSFRDHLVLNRTGTHSDLFE